MFESMKKALDLLRLEQAVHAWHPVSATLFARLPGQLHLMQEQGESAPWDEFRTLCTIHTQAGDVHGVLELLRCSPDGPARAQALMLTHDFWRSHTPPAWMIPWDAWLTRTPQDGDVYRRGWLASGEAQEDQRREALANAWRHVADILMHQAMQHADWQHWRVLSAWGGTDTAYALSYPSEHAVCLQYRNSPYCPARLRVLWQAQQTWLAHLHSGLPVPEQHDADLLQAAEGFFSGVDPACAYWLLRFWSTRNMGEPHHMQTGITLCRYAHSLPAQWRLMDEDWSYAIAQRPPPDPHNWAVNGHLVYGPQDHADVQAWVSTLPETWHQAAHAETRRREMEYQAFVSMK
ncbi:MAG: hypothetical protein Q4G39_02145 [Brachymonas sp.]|nr:hypothetical protein [Brachymonas sp.]